MAATSTTDDVQVRDLQIEWIRTTKRNPRSAKNHDHDDAEDAGLAASIGSEDESRMVQLPVVEQIGAKEFVLIIGERRVNAAKARHYKKIKCLVRQRLDPMAAHTMRLLENLHRQDLHPLDEAVSLKIAWLCANAEAMNVGGAAREVLEKDKPPFDQLRDLLALLEKNNFAPTKPAVSWDRVLDELGVSMSASERKRKLRVLSLEADTKKMIADVDITEAGLRALGKLKGEAQIAVAQQIAEDPKLASRVASISNLMSTRGFSVEEAINQVKHGRATGTAEEDEVKEEASSSEDRAVKVMNAGDQMIIALQELKTAVGEGGLEALPEPFNGLVRAALKNLQDEIKQVAGA